VVGEAARKFLRTGSARLDELFIKPSEPAGLPLLARMHPNMGGGGAPRL